MDLQLLKSFIALADAGSFTKAAARQHLSQPAFSRRIRNLEHWVGSDLVDRSTYPVVLTHAGQQLRRRAAELLEGLQEVRDEARGYRQAARGAVRVVTSHALAFSFFPRWWRQVSAGPAQPCKVTACNTLDAYDALTAGACDLLLTYTDPAHPVDLDPAEFEYTSIGSDIFAPYALNVDGRPKFWLPGTVKSPVPVLDYGEGAFFGRMVDAILRRTEQPPYVETVLVTDLAPGLMASALDGAGIAWLPGMLVAGAGDQLVPAGRSQWCRELDLRVYRPRDVAGEHAAIGQIWQHVCPGRDVTWMGLRAHSNVE